jgi:putative hydrolase
VSTSEPDDRSNPFQFLLGDLMQVLGANAPDQWPMTRSFAWQVATGGSPEDNVDPMHRIYLEELARVAELHVAEETGLPLSSDGRRVTCLPVGRGEWATRTLDAWRPVLAAMAPAPAPAAPTPPDEPDADLDPTAGLGNLIGQWATAIGPMFFGLQVGSVVGHLSHRALGQYAIALPWPPPGDEVLLVTPNIQEFADAWSLPAEEALLWVCARELASHAVLTRPGVRRRMTELLESMVTATAAAQQSLQDRLGGIGSSLAGDGLGALGSGGMDLESLQAMFGDPEALLGGLLTPDSQRTSEQLTSLVVVVDAYADHVAGRIGKRLVGAHAPLAEAWYRRRIERGKGEEAAGSLFGLDLEQAQVDRGRSFVDGVVERAGESGLSLLWSEPRNLPTPPEVDAPGLWLERIQLPELSDPDTGDASDAGGTEPA